mmetsp:Transcript_8974/g.33842  ORF Transcript_8974/g.33842 Transcript_8974/m.33842 type:complete len:120 (-) Transcript_8974:52-411(-)
MADFGGMDSGDGGEGFLCARVNGSLLSNNIGRTVSLVGTIESQNDGLATLLTSDGIKVTIQQQAGAYYTGPVVEIIGRVSDGQTVEELQCREFGGDYDKENYNALVELMNGKYKEVFTA